MNVETELWNLLNIEILRELIHERLGFPLEKCTDELIMPYFEKTKGNAIDAFVLFSVDNNLKPV